MNKFYVYVLRRPNGEPFYVGMGSGRRLEVHEATAKTNDQSLKSRLIRKIWANGGEVVREVVARCETALQAAALEVELIKKFGRRDIRQGPLVNLTDGGDGVHGLSESARIAHREMTSAGMQSEAVRKACRENLARLRSDPTLGSRFRDPLVAYWKDPVNRERQAQRVRSAAVADPVRAEELKNIRRSAVRSDESRAKMSAAKKGKKQSPELVSKRAAALKNAVRPADIGQRISAGKKAAAAKRALLKQSQMDA